MSRAKRKKKRVFGTSERPRLVVYKGIRNIQAQVVNDENGTTLVSASTIQKDMKKKLKHGGNVEAAKAVGEAIAGAAVSKGIKKVVFDRGWSLYHGRVKALAEAARAAGLEF